MRIDELRQCVEVFDLLLPQSSAVAPVESSNVGLNGFYHLLPLVSQLLWYRPPIVAGIFYNMTWGEGGRERGREERGREEEKERGCEGGKGRERYKEEEERVERKEETL